MDEGKQRFGLKDTQLGLRLSDMELETLTRVQAHWGLSLSDWVTYALLRFVAYQRVQPTYNLSPRALALCSWIPLSPAPHFRHCRVGRKVKAPFMYFADIPTFATAARWVLLDEASRVLATPSKAMSLVAQDIKRPTLSLVSMPSSIYTPYEEFEPEDDHE